MLDDGAMGMKVSVVVLTRNCASVLPRCLASIQHISCDIVVIDDFSTDETVAVARRFGARVFRHHLRSFAEQRNFGISHSLQEWVFHLDSDETASQSLVNIIADLTDQNNDAYRIPRRNIIFGQALIHGGLYPDSTIRLHRRSLHFVGAVHEKVAVEAEKVGNLVGDIIHYSTDSTRSWISKLLIYAPLEPPQSLVRSVLRGVRSFVRDYICRGGFLDGPVALRWFLLSSLYPLLCWSLGQDNGQGGMKK